MHQFSGRNTYQYGLLSILYEDEDNLDPQEEHIYTSLVIGSRILPSLECFWQSHNGSLTGSYARHGCFPPGSLTSKHFENVRKSGRPWWDWSVRAIWASGSCSSSAVCLSLLVSLSPTGLSLERRADCATNPGMLEYVCFGLV
jgi:hypothetical protein